MGVRQWKSILWLLRGRLSRWLFMSKLCTKIKRCGRKFRIFDIYVVSEGDKGKKVSNEKPTKNWKLRRLKLRRLTGNQMSTPNFIYKMTSVIRYTHWVNLGVKRPRNWKKKWKTFIIGFPGNWPNFFIFSESKWFTESFPVFWNNRSQKNVMAISNPGIQPIFNETANDLFAYDLWHKIYADSANWDLMPHFVVKSNFTSSYCVQS